MNNLFTSYRQRLQELLPHSPEIQAEIYGRLCQRISLNALELLACSTCTFFRYPAADGQWRICVCLQYAGIALPCQPRWFDECRELCTGFWELAALSEIIIRGTDGCHRLRRVANGWIQEVV